MVKQLENEIRDLQKELAELKKTQSVLRLHPCMGDAEIKVKEEKSEELDRRIKTLNAALRDMTRKRQLMIYQDTIKENKISLKIA